VSRDSPVGIATRYRLDGPGTNPGGGEIFRVPPERLWGPPGLLCNGYRISLSGVKQPGRGLYHVHHLAPRLKKEQSHSPTPCSRVNFTFAVEQLANIKLCFRGYRQQTKYLKVFEEMNLDLVPVSWNDLKDCEGREEFEDYSRSGRPSVARNPDTDFGSSSAGTQRSSLNPQIDEGPTTF